VTDRKQVLQHSNGVQQLAGRAFAHPQGHEQTVLNFKARKPVATFVPLALIDEELD
jgi:hypothetical protein